MSDKESSCDGEFDPNSLTVDQAFDKIIESIQPVDSCEKIAIRSALDRTLFEDVASTIDVPGYTNSAMDGYAINFGDYNAESKSEFVVCGVAYAGKSYNESVTKGQCARIMTGAKMPTGTDTVIMQEHVSRNDDVICVEKPPKEGQNVRQKGEDLKTGQAALEKGLKLKPADIGLIASLGIAEVKVSRKLRIAFFSTGDELRSIGETLESGQIYDSNRYTIFSMLKQLGVDVIDMGIVKDDPESIKTAFIKAADNSDAFITSGGVSVGDADYVKQTLEEIGQVNFWKIAMKPGRPLAVGKVNNAHFFGLPGNPVSAMATFYQFVQPALRKLSGQKQFDAPRLKLKSISNLKKRPGRIDYQRGIIFKDENGESVVKSTGNQGSHVLSSMSQANCFIVLSLESSNVDAGEWVEVQPFHGLM